MYVCTTYNPHPFLSKNSSYCFFNSLLNHLTPLATHSSLTSLHTITNCVFLFASSSKMRFPISYSRAPARRTVGGFNTALAAAEARRRRMIPIRMRNGGFSRSRRSPVNRESGFVPPPLPPNIINQGMMVFLFCKRLQNSDVNNVGRIVLPKRSAEIHLPRLLDHESFKLPVLDMDGGAAWSFKFRYWPNNVSRMFVFEGTGPFIRKYGLQTGDYILMYKDMVTWNYMIRGVKASEAEGGANQETTATEGNNMDNVVLNDNAAGNVVAVENGVVAEVGAFDLPDISDNFLKAESIAGTSFVNDDDSYFSDILNSFSSWDEIKDYYYSPTQPNVTSDNLSSKDLSQV